MNPEKTITHLLQNNPALIDLLRQLELVKKIDVMLHKALREILFNAASEPLGNKEIINSIHAIKFEQGKLQLSCENSAISMRLRYLLPELIHKLRAENYLHHLITIELKVKPQILKIPPEIKKNLTSIKHLSHIKAILAKID